MKTGRKHKEQLIRAYTDGSGCRPDGKGSALAWLREDTGQKKVEKIDGLTNNEAEYGAVISLLKSLPNKSIVEILCDSQLVVCQFDGTWKVSQPKLAELLSQARNLIDAKALIVRLVWISRRSNLAGKML